MTERLGPQDIPAVIRDLHEHIRRLEKLTDQDTLEMMPLAKGDLKVGLYPGVWEILGVGTDTQVLTADSAEDLGVKWTDFDLCDIVCPVDFNVTAGDDINMAAADDITITAGTGLAANFGPSVSSLIQIVSQSGAYPAGIEIQSAPELGNNVESTIHLYTTASADPDAIHRIDVDTGIFEVTGQVDLGGIFKTTSGFTEILGGIVRIGGSSSTVGVLIDSFGVRINATDPNADKISLRSTEFVVIDSPLVQVYYGSGTGAFVGPAPMGPPADASFPLNSLWSIYVDQVTDRAKIKIKWSDATFHTYEMGGASSLFPGFGSPVNVGTALADGAGTSAARNNHVHALGAVDGTGLTIAAGVLNWDGATIQDEGASQGLATTLDFVGAGVTAGVAGGVATITIPGASPLFFNVMDYGATGDGVTDDTTAIQDALDAASVAGGIVFFPPGIYLTTATLTWATGVVLLGSGMMRYDDSIGTMIDYTGSGYAMDLASVLNPAIRDLRININSPALGCLNLADPCTRGQFDHVTFSGYGTTDGYGVLFSGETSCVCHHHFIGCQWVNFVAGIRASGFANANLFENCDFQTVEIAVHAEAIAPDTVSFSGNVFLRCEFDSGVTTAVKFRDVAQYNEFISCGFDGPTASLDFGDGCDYNQFVGGSLGGGTVTLTGSSAETTMFLNTLPYLNEIRFGDVFWYRDAAGTWKTTNTVRLAGTVLNNPRIDVASATVITLPEGNWFQITGTTTIDAIDGATDGREVTLQFAASVTVKNDGAGGDYMKLAGAVDFAATTLDTLTLMGAGGIWFEKCRSVN